MKNQWEYWKKLLDKPGVVDVIIFGSSVRGKANPQDTDICVVWGDKKGQTDGAIDMKYEELFAPSFLAREDILADGFSVRLGKSLAESFGYFTFRVFDYSLGKMDYNKRARFHSAMRKVSEELGILKFRALALVPIGASEKFGEFLEYWGAEYRESRMLFPRQEYEFLKAFPIRAEADLLWENKVVGKVNVSLKEETGAFVSDGNFNPNKLVKDHVSGIIVEGILEGDIEEIKASPFFKLRVHHARPFVVKKLRLDSSTFPSLAGQFVYGKKIDTEVKLSK
ncbi:MAG: hypothetical protein GOV01_02545 [Candidatus Altiarchaeota archaeon]|nr:hypothetical protein [Candidatus Altiarchaeota archaeon]